jgi:hypothetical protein
LELVKERLNLADFMRMAVERHSRVASTKAMQICLDARVPEDTIVVADPWRLRQVMDNLLSNAIKFSPAGSEVHVDAERVADGWRISVQDNGPGIRPEERARLFQPFERLSARPTGDERSTGLGLSITRRVIEAHGGVIDVISTPGHGARFWFTLPDPPASGDGGNSSAGR